MRLNQVQPDIEHGKLSLEMDMPEGNARSVSYIAEVKKNNHFT
ncbi:hypothetical protein [Halobacillus kuroshimensis]